MRSVAGKRIIKFDGAIRFRQCLTAENAAFIPLMLAQARRMARIICTVHAATNTCAANAALTFADNGHIQTIGSVEHGLACRHRHRARHAI